MPGGADDVGGAGGSQYVEGRGGVVLWMMASAGRLLFHSRGLSPREREEVRGEGASRSRGGVRPPVSLVHPGPVTVPSVRVATSVSTPHTDPPQSPRLEAPRPRPFLARSPPGTRLIRSVRLVAPSHGPAGTIACILKPSMTSYAGSTASRRRDHPQAYQPFPSSSHWSNPAMGSDALLRARVPSHTSQHSHDSRRRPATGTAASAGAWDSASESGLSVLSALPHARDAFEDRAARKARKAARRQQRARRDAQAQALQEAPPAADATDSPLRRWARWVVVDQPGLARYSVVLCVVLVVLVKWCAGLGGYSGACALLVRRGSSFSTPLTCRSRSRSRLTLPRTGLAQPPLRGDFEAQRHWLAVTSSSVSHLPFLHAPSAPPSSSLSVPPSRWYFHDLPYWGLDYPPLTAYHSLLLGVLARLHPASAQYVTLRPDSATASSREVAAWEAQMAWLERDGGMKNWMRATVVGGDLLVWVSAVVVYCRRNFRASSSLSSSSSTKADKSQRRMVRLLSHASRLAG